MNPRRVGLVLGILALALVVVLVVAFGARGFSRWVSEKDGNPDQTTLRHRVDLIEHDPFVLALLATPHSSRSQLEMLRCRTPLRSDRWNYRGWLRGADATQVTGVLATAASYGWTSSPADSTNGWTAYRKAIEPGVAAVLFERVQPTTFEVTVSVSAGLSCLSGG